MGFSAMSEAHHHGPGHHEHAVTPPFHDTPDPWHRHSPAEKPQRAHGEATSFKQVLGIGLGSFLIVTITVYIVYGYYTWYTTDILNQQEGFGNGLELPAKTVKEAAFADLAGYGWVKDQDNYSGYVQMPIQRGMEKVVAEYSVKK